MRTLCAFILIATFASALPGQLTQVPAGNSDGGVTVTIHDGGVDQVLQSIFIPPVQNAPFTAIVHTQWIRPLVDGGTYTVVNQRQVARDRAGRIYEERWWLVPKGGSRESQMNLIQIANPATQTIYNCYLLETPHRCVLEPFHGSSKANYQPPVGQSGALANGFGFQTHEDLGVQTIEGIDTHGTRDTTTYNQGVIGNDRPINRVREYWFASSLEINLRSELSDPSFGKQIFTLTNVSTSDPDPKLFELPDGFAVVDLSKPAAPSQ